MKWAGNKAVYSCLLLIFLIVGFTLSGGQKEYGIWSLLPPLVMFVFILCTQRVLEGFLWGSTLAVFMKYKTETLTVYNDKLFAQLTNADNLWLIVVLLLIGAFISVLDKSGLSQVFGSWVSDKAKTSKSALLLTYFMPIVLSNDAYLGTSTVGATMTPVNDKHRTPRAFSSFIVRSTAVPANIFNPFSTVAVFITGLLVINNYAEEGNGTQAYIELLPYMFFCGAILLVALLSVLGIIPKIGPMKKALHNSVDESMEDDTIPPAHQEMAAAIAVEKEEAKKVPHVINFFIPIIALVAATLYLDGNIQLGAVTSLVISGILLIAQGKLKADEYLEAVLSGMKDMFSLAFIMAIAFVLVDSITELGFSQFIIDSVSGNVNAKFLPIIIFVIFSITEFLVTLNFSLYILAIPVLVPLAANIGADPNLTIAAIISAGIWGTTASITSDIGMLTAYSSKIELFKHYITNLPYQFIAWILAALAYLIVGLLG